MILRILGCSGTEARGHSPTSFLIDRTLLVDTGAVCSALDIDEQLAINRVLITHPHLDHVRGLPILADNLNLADGERSLTVIGIPQVLEIIWSHLLNDLIWPDFNKIPSKEKPVLVYRSIREESEFPVDDFRILAFPSSHSVPSVGYRIARDGKVLVFSGDTGPTDRLWYWADGTDALIIDVSFPNRMEQLALMSGHLTPRLLARELTKCQRLPRRICISHIKPQFYHVVRTELEELHIPTIQVLRDGDEIEV